MPRLKIRLLATATTVVVLSALVLPGRSRSKPTFAPRMTEPSSAPAMSPSEGAAPVGQNRLTQPQREQETTIRPRTTTQPAPQPVRSVDPVAQDKLIALVEEAIGKTARRYLDVKDYTPWQIMHGVLALRGDYKLKQNGKVVSGIDFISSGPTYRGDYWWEKTAAGGRGHPYSVPYHFEGHINQFPALLAMSALPLDHKLVAKGGTITVGDLVRNAQRTCNTNEEISWTLWLLTQYVNQDAEWVNQQGQHWSMAELVRLQVADGVNDAPCGGTHGLFALAFSRNAYLKQHGQLRGVWVNSEYKLRQYMELARQLQNPDGSFSTNWFKGRGYTNDFKERIKTSGHMLEWLMMALPASRLEEPWVLKGIQSVANDLIRNASAPAECGPMYHAVHALVLYRERVAPPKSTTPPEQLAARPATPVIPAPMPAVASTNPAPTPAAAIPPAPAAPVASGVVPPKSTAQAATPGIQANLPAQPGIVRITPAAPGTTAASALAMPAPLPAVAAAPLVVSAEPLPPLAAPGVATQEVAAPAMLAAPEARPLIADGESATPSPVSGEPAGPKPLLVLQQPAPAAPKTDAAAMSSSAADSAAAPAPETAATEPSDLPAESLPTDLPPALPASVAASEAPEETPPAMTETTVPAESQPVAASSVPGGLTPPTATATADAEAPILPQVTADPVQTAEDHPDPVTELTLESGAATDLAKPTSKPETATSPAPPVRVSTAPAEAADATQQ